VICARQEIAPAPAAVHVSRYRQWHVQQQHKRRPSGRMLLPQLRHNPRPCQQQRCWLTFSCCRHCCSSRRSATSPSCSHLIGFMRVRMAQPTVTQRPTATACCLPAGSQSSGSPDRPRSCVGRYVGPDSPKASPPGPCLAARSQVVYILSAARALLPSPVEAHQRAPRPSSAYTASPAHSHPT
jgi:hypothetical protein